MSDDTFAFIFHPIQIKKDVNRKFPGLGTLLPEPVINWASRFFPPLYISEITGITSQETGRGTRGWFLAAPYTPPTMLKLPVEMVYDKLVATAEKAAGLGARIVGLGAFTSVVGDAGVTIAERVDVPVTTGDSYTVAIAVEALQEAARLMDIQMQDATVAVVGATGAIGRACSLLLSANDTGRLILVGKREDALNAVREECEGGSGDLLATTAMSALYAADLIVTVTSAVHAVIEPQHLKPGAVVLDVARPRDVSGQVAEQRDDVLVVEGGMVAVPGAEPNFNFDFGFPPRKVFACMAETIALSLEGRYEDYTLGRRLALAQIQEIQRIATRHGFKLAGLRSFEHAIPQTHIDRVRARAHETRRHWSPATA